MTATPLPDPTNMDAVRAWLANRRPDVDAVRAWARQLLADLAPVPALGSAEWLALSEQDPRKLAAAVRPGLAYLVDSTPEAIADRLRVELDAFATAWRRTFSDASGEISRAMAGLTTGPSHAQLVRRRQLTTTVPCRACGTAVTLAHPLPEEYAARLPDLSWVRCADCPQTVPLAATRGRDAA